MLSSEDRSEGVKHMKPASQCCSRVVLCSGSKYLLSLLVEMPSFLGEYE